MAILFAHALQKKSWPAPLHTTRHGLPCVDSWHVIVYRITSACFVPSMTSWYELTCTVNSLLTDSPCSGLLRYNRQLTWSQLTLACFVYKKNTSIADTPSIFNSGRWPRSQVTFLIQKKCFNNGQWAWPRDHTPVPADPLPNQGIFDLLLVLLSTGTTQLS